MVGDIILRCIHRDSVGGIKLIESMAAMGAFNFLFLLQVYNDRAFDSAIHSHTIFVCNNRHGEQVGYLLCVVVHFKVGEKI